MRQLVRILILNYLYLKKDGEKMRRRRENWIDSIFWYIFCVAVILIVVMLAFNIGKISVSGQLLAGDQTSEVSTGQKGVPEDGIALWSGSSRDEGLLTIVNADHPMPEDWQYELVSLINGQNVDSRAYNDLQKMMDDARAEGLDPYICSSWRNHETQEQLFEEEIENYVRRGYSKSEARVQAAQWVAVPGTSEHELGLALDIVSIENQRLEEAQEDTETQQWLMEHCYEYGFILRYPKDKEDITGISYEPWHYRYVGREDAAAIRDMGVCLEEYVAQE